jgi:hypothetical protein
LALTPQQSREEEFGECRILAVILGVAQKRLWS